MLKRNDKCAQIRVNISLPKEFHKKHVKVAFEAHISFSAYVRLCLERPPLIENLLPLERPILPLGDDS